MDQATETLVPFLQLFFYGGLLALMVGIPVFIWLAVRFCRDVHSIAESLHWISHCTKPQDAEARSAAAPGPMLSAFGRR